MENPKPQSMTNIRWSLEDLLPNGPEPQEDLLEQLETRVKVIEAFRPQLDERLFPEVFTDILHAIESVSELAAKVSAFAYLSFAENTQSSNALSLQDRISQIITDIENRTMFFSLWFKELPDKTAKNYIAVAGDTRYYLETIRRFKPFTLSEPEEKVINLKDINGSQALVKIYEIITNGFTFSMEVGGEPKKLTRDGLTQYYRHPSPSVREAAYRELYRVFGENRIVLAQIYAYLVRDWGTEGVDLRGYSSPIAIRNLGNDIPDGVVDTMLDVCHRNAALFQRYFLLKASQLGMEKLKRYDIYAPIAKSEKKVSIKEAVTLVLDCFGQFSPQVAEGALQVLERAHLDAEIRPGKRGGAFSYSPSPKLIPWVLVNYNGRIRDVTTLAHELGHSVHAIMASSHSILTFHPPQPLAETASVFAEMLVTNRLLEQESDRAIKRDLLMTILDDAYATVERQAFISIFEREAHNKIAQGGTSEDLAALYRHGLDQQFGEAVELSDEFAWEWLTIPHIFNSPFYTYAYSFGQLLVLSLYQQYLNKPVDFVPRYIRLLSYGGSAAPQAILTEASLDISSPEFWQGGFDVLQTMLEQLEQIIGGYP